MRISQPPLMFLINSFFYQYHKVNDDGDDGDDDILVLKWIKNYRHH